MGAATKLSYEEFLQLPEEPGKRFELDRGDLVVERSPTFRHNRIRDRICRHLGDFVSAHRLGGVTSKNDFRLARDVVRNPDVAFVATEPLSHMDIDSSPIEGVPNLAIEVVSPSASAQGLLTKIHQYLNAGCQAVWVFYPKLRAAEIHDALGTRQVSAPALLKEEAIFAGHSYSLPLSPIFEEDVTK